jgi:DNA mismatch repair protein MutL
MDVNISPSKTEIKLENEQIIFQILEAAVKEAIGMNAFAPAIDFDTEGVPTEITTGDGFTLTKEQKESARRNGGFKPPVFSTNPLFNPFDSHTIPSKINSSEENRYNPNKIENEQELLIEEPSALKIIQVDKNNVVATDLSGDIMIVNIPRARQRIFYENYLNSIRDKKCAIQQELFPKSVTLDHATFTTLISNLNKVEMLGFEVREFGKDCVVVSGTPADFRGGLFSVEECIEEIAHLIETKSEEEFLKKAAMEIVRHTNFSYSERITESEAAAVINQLLCCNDSATAPNGGYCILRIGAAEIAKRMM